MASEAQHQTSDVFGHKWQKRSTFESQSSLTQMRKWLIERYGDIENAAWWSDYGDHPTVLDAGCGAAMSAIELFGSRLKQVKYTGVDISEAVDVARQRFSERGLPGVFIRSDICNLSMPDETFDVIFSEGVLHHTDSTRNALISVAKKLRKGGRFLFYVYRRKGPVREFTDDMVREKLQSLSPSEAWEAMYPLTILGEALGKLNVKVNVPVAVDLLGIPAGEIDIQRLFYWHVAKTYYRDDMTIDEMNHINFDWFAPRNAHRQTLPEVLSWCEEAHLRPENVDEQEAGITIVAIKQ